jgi:hypothetical protein
MPIDIMIAVLLRTADLFEYLASLEAEIALSI